jgi:GH24 family phage-related lysozyme (muramidase)
VGRAFIRGWEVQDHHGQPYTDITPDSRHNPTFGYGHKVEPGELSALQAQLGGLGRQGRAALIDKMFEQDLTVAEQRVKDRLGPEALSKLAQNQLDALVADAFNAGAGGALGPQMLQNIWDGDLDAAGKQFNAVSGTDAKTGQKKVLGGLVKRSLQEAAIFNRGDYDYTPTAEEAAALRRSAGAKRAPPR